MSDEALQFGLMQELEATGGPPPDKKMVGVSVATVINNIDATGQARVQLMLPWLAGAMPWARLATPMAGMARGFYMVPMIGDEVLVAFHNGDVREPYVIGACWNTLDVPPALLPTDPLTKRLIRTPLGHSLTFDDALQQVTLTTNTMCAVTLGPDGATLSTPTASVAVKLTGEVSLTAKTKLTLSAPVIEIDADASLVLKSNGQAALQAAGDLTVKGITVMIN